MADKITSKIVNKQIVVTFRVNGVLCEEKFPLDATVDAVKLGIAQSETNYLAAKKTVQDLAKVTSIDAASEIEAQK
jgi:hypothetical protein